MAIREIPGAFLGKILRRFDDWRRKKGGRLFGAASLGQSLVIMAIAFLGMIAFVGFVVDTGIIYLHRVWLGQAIDAASLAAGYELPNIKGACARAVEYLQANGYEPGPDFSFQIIFPARPDAPVPPGDPGAFVIDSIDDSIIDPGDCASVYYASKHSDMHYEVQIAATQEVPVIFMHILGFGTINVTAPSGAERSSRYDIALILDRSGSMKFDTCSLIRPEDEYGCQNRYNLCTTFYAEDFQDDDDLGDVEGDGWVIIGNATNPKNVEFITSGDPSIDLLCKSASDPGDPSPFSYDFTCVDDTIIGSVLGYANVLLDHCTVTGDVDVKDGHLDITSSTINGSLMVRDTWLNLDDSSVGGNVDVIAGTNDDVDYVISYNEINANVNINQGGRLRIVGNEIGGNLEAKCPTIVITASGNDVDGVTQLCSDPLPAPVCGAIYRTISTLGKGDVGLFFTVTDVNLESNDALEVYWRPNSGVGWSQIAEYGEAELPDGLSTPFGVMLPSAAYDNPNLQIRFETANHTIGRLAIDDIQLRACPDTPGPWGWYVSDSEPGCWETKPMTCESDDWDTIMPGVSISGDEPPIANLMEQPMLDTLLAAEAFIDLVDSRRVSGAPREDQIGLVDFETEADILLELTTDYEAIKDELFTNFWAWGGTNIGGGMRLGLSVLGDGRWNSTHCLILLTDGWPTHYDFPFENPTSFGIRCPTPGGQNLPCEESLEYIDAMIENAIDQNVTIFTIGLGDVVTDTFDATVADGAGWTTAYSGMDLLERIANGTNGQAYHAPTTEELEVIFGWIAEAIFIRITR